MCGIAGILSLSGAPLPDLERRLALMNQIQQHRGPDAAGIWSHPTGRAGMAHRRLSIIDIAGGHQPMSDAAGNWIVFNGEIYNYVELRDQLGREHFATRSDTEVILHAYQRWGSDCVQHLRGMFAFAIWDEARRELFCARDRFGIKPLYYAIGPDAFIFASEAKAILPFLERIETDVEGFRDYLTFQFCLGGKTLFRGVSELEPGHRLRIADERIVVDRYWEIYYELDWDHTERYFEERIRHLLQESVSLHLRADVPVGAYVSGGVDSGVVASLATRHTGAGFKGFTGKFSLGPEYDESDYARQVAEHGGFELLERDISVHDFIANIRKVIYHLDYPVAGPGSFPQYMISELASRHQKVVLGGQGGDELFGGYTRYLIAYFEQCIRAAIDGTMNNGNFIVTYESIIPNLEALKNYKPLLRRFWQEGLFEDLDRRYFTLINRAPDLHGEIRWEYLNGYSPFDTFQTIFHGRNVRKESYFDLMTHFDFKTLLPALLQVEDRVSMAHGLEARVPLLDHPLVELAATIPSSIKFKDGTMKHVFRNAVQPYLPAAILQRKDKMGFPVPLMEWVRGEARDFVLDTLSTSAARGRDLVDNSAVLRNLDKEPKFGRKLWGLLSLELWQQEFHDCRQPFTQRLDTVEVP
jgi:asparagine synthase (glutamine-hydrolysing)